MSFIDSSTSASNFLSSKFGCGNGMFLPQHRNWALNRDLVFTAVDEGEGRRSHIEGTLLADQYRIAFDFAQQCGRLQRKGKTVDMIDAVDRFEQRIKVRETRNSAEVP